MTTQKALHARIKREAQEDAPRPGQYGNESHQRAFGFTDLQVAKVTVDVKSSPVSSSAVAPVFWFLIRGLRKFIQRGAFGTPWCLILSSIWPVEMAKHSERDC
jgi:hypothetical protein